MTAGASRDSVEQTLFPTTVSLDRAPHTGLLDAGTLEDNPETPHLPSPLDELLNRKFRPLKEHPTEHTRSTETREPKYFDMHLHPSLRLRQVEFIDELPTALSRLCESYAARICPSALARLDTLEGLYSKPAKACTNEASVQRHLLSVGNDHARLASGLLFGVGWYPLLCCSEKPKGCDNFTNAVADSYTFATSDDDILSHLSNADRQNIDLIEKYHFQNFVTEEYKNLLCGKSFLTTEMMRSLAGTFPWTTCAENGSMCRTSTHRIGGRLKVTGRQTGPDSSPTVEFLNETMNRRSSKISAQCKRESLVASEEVPSCPDPRDVEERERQHAHDVLQQVWASAVVQDATFIVISSGNMEYIGIRHRGAQTLFLSSLIRPNDENSASYIKIRVALCIAAYRDALSRAMILEQSSRKSTLASLNLFQLRLDEQLQVRKAEEVDKDQLKLEREQAKLVDQQIMLQLKRASMIYLWTHSIKLAAKQKTTWTLQRVVRKGLTVAHPSGSGNWTMHLDLQQQLHSGVYKGYSRMEDKQSKRQYSLSHPLVLKMAWNDAQARSLKREHRNCVDIGNIAGIAKNYGLFSSQIGPSEVYFFKLEEYCGVSLLTRMNYSTKSSRINLKKYSSVNYEKGASAALNSFHKKGWIHNNISPKTIVLGKKKVKLVNLRRSTRPPPDVFEQMRQKEIEEFQRCFGTPMDETESVSTNEEGSEFGDAPCMQEVLDSEDIEDSQDIEESQDTEETEVDLYDVLQ